MIGGTSGCLYEYRRNAERLSGRSLAHSAISSPGPVRAGMLPGIVRPRQCLPKRLDDKHLHIPHHESVRGGRVSNNSRVRRDSGDADPAITTPLHPRHRNRHICNSVPCRDLQTSMHTASRAGEALHSFRNPLRRPRVFGEISGSLACLHVRRSRYFYRLFSRAAISPRK